MNRWSYLFVALLVFVPVLIWGCDEQEDPAAPEKPAVEEPDAPDEQEDPDDDYAPTNDVEESDKPWKAANQLQQEKTTTVIMEGMEEEIALKLHVSSLYPYALYLDTERYHPKEKDNKDLIQPRAEVKPEVFMAIWHQENTSATEMLSKLEEQLKEKYPEVHMEGSVETPLPSQHLYAQSGSAWDDTKERYYLIEDQQDGVFVVQQKLFNEAVEGHGSRFNNILSEFFSWNPDKNEFVPH